MSDPAVTVDVVLLECGHIFFTNVDEVIECPLCENLTEVKQRKQIEFEGEPPELEKADLFNTGQSEAVT